jgi:hypothetical protein
LAFTLVEMIVVVAIVVVVVGLVLPAITAMWNERKLSESVNTLQGLFMTSRARALRPDSGEVGFFAYVDEDGAQHLAPIEPHPCAVANPAWQDIFVFSDQPDQVLPAPMRVMPRYAVVRKSGAPAFEEFNDDELDNTDFAKPYDQTQRHRNFFAMVFSRDGLLLARPVVLIQDKDEDEDNNGDRTGLWAGKGDPDAKVDCTRDHPEATTTRYYPLNSPASGPAPIDGQAGTAKFPWLLLNGEGAAVVDVAINFPSVDGLLVYDDSLFNAIPKDQKREYLLRTAQPLYVSRFTGKMIRGPVGGQ